MSRLTMAAAAALLSITLAACGGGSDGGSSAGGDATDGAIAVTGTDDLKFDKTELTAPAGEITFELTCGDAVEHDITIEGQNGDEPVAVCAAGETATGSIELEAGSYTYYCSVPGHRAAGMEGELTVEG
jgi:plastocyanin